MKSVDCDIIRDLLPGYSDKILSETSNKLVQKHLKECDDCLKEFQEMNKEIPSKFTKIQEEEIDYLRGYRKNKKITIIFSIIITICVLVIISIALFVYNNKAEYTYPISQIDAILVDNLPNTNDNTLLFRIENIKYNYKMFEHKETNENNDTIIYLKFIGKCPLIPEMESGTRTIYDFKIDETVANIYLENDNGEVKEIWNKNKGSIVQNYEKTYQVVYIKNTDFEEIQKLENDLKDNSLIEEVSHVYDREYESVIIVAKGSNTELNKLKIMLEELKIIERVKVIE